METIPRLSQLVVRNIPTYLPTNSTNRELNPLHSNQTSNPTQESKMCNVQRVTNTCGHINDHVLMSCYAANGAVARAAVDPQAAAAENVIQNAGFHARNQPYCKSKTPKVLDSPKGFKCMVLGCGRAG